MPDDQQDLERNKDIVMRYVNEVQRGHSITTLGEIFAEDFVDHSMMFDGVFDGGLEKLAAGIMKILEAFPDLVVEIELLIAEDNKVVAYKHFSATHLGSWKGVPATGKRVEWKLVSIYGIRDGKIAEYWGLIDDSGINKNLGLQSSDS